MKNIEIYSSSKAPTTISENKEPCGSVLTIPTNENGYARFERTTQVTVDDNEDIPFTLYVTPQIDGDFVSDFTNITVREGVYLISLFLNATSTVAPKNIDILLKNTREDIPSFFGYANTTENQVSITGSYVIELLENTNFVLHNNSGNTINVESLILNFVKLRNFAFGSTSIL